jgi:hypothetical protein
MELEDSFNKILPTGSDVSLGSYISSDLTINVHVSNNNNYSSFMCILNTVADFNI